MSPPTSASAQDRQAPAIAEDVAVGAIWTPIARDPMLTSAPIRFFTTPRRNRRRITLIGERFNLRHPCPEAATALILATVLANRLRADLRVVTREESIRPDELDQLLKVHGLGLHGESTFLWAPAQGPDVEIDRFDDELVLAASCPSATAALAAAPARDVVCLLQADERLLHPPGDQHDRCEALLQRQDLWFVVHTRALRARLIQQGLANFETRALSFEPAFPRPTAQPSPRQPGDKRHFVLQAPAGGSGGLFGLGVAAIERAIAEGLLDQQRWEFSFIGRELPEVGLAGWQRPIRLHDLEASAYVRLLGKVDLGLTLSPPGASSGKVLEMAASGSVVVTNASAGEQPSASSNIIACSPNLDTILQGLRTAIAIVEDEPQRLANHAQTHWQRDWTQALHDVVETLVAHR